MKKGTKKENTTARKTRQINLHDSEVAEVYELAGLNAGSLGNAIRTVIERHKDQITENNNLKQHLKQLTAQEAGVK
jgi:hypothetical protein